ncbi:hypothetical protein V6X62_02680 [Spiribacter sp. 218]|uniref:hypothetical protein n=1 Tax=Spiribacter pallidus TaxID=1987936 RepID=UPI00349FAB42
MRAVLHIGTHKTGTSSIQNALATNSAALAAQGIHYPRSVRGPRNVNFLAAAIAAGRIDEARRFIDQSVARAHRQGCTTVLFSAESLYAMTAFFRRLMGKEAERYWVHERACIATLIDLLQRAGIGDPPQVVCYLRRQDRFIESIYGQFVKQAPGYPHDLATFIDEAGPIDDYAGHLDCWAAIVGQQRVIARVYEDARSRLLDDFLDTAHGIRDASAFTRPAQPVNESLDLATLAFKRALNRVPVPLAEAYVHSKVVAHMTRDDAAPSGPLMDRATRRTLMKRQEAGNRHVAREYAGREDGSLFPSDDPEAAPGPGLTPERAIVLRHRFRREIARPGVRAEIMLRRSVRYILDRAPGLETVLVGVRYIANQRRIRMEREGRA